VKIPICETFSSVQGEQAGLGRYAFFIRTYGCNLGNECPIDCDTRYAWDSAIGDPSDHLEPEELADLVLSQARDMVVITGGEPLLWQDRLVQVIDRARALGSDDIDYFFETNGTIEPLQALFDDRFVHFNVSPKRADFDYSRFPDVRSIFKHVVDRETENLDQLADRFKELEPAILRRVFFMPSAKDQAHYRKVAPEIAAWCVENRFNFGPRLHLELRIA
jgi:organic radical activating enzyme